MDGCFLNYFSIFKAAEKVTLIVQSTILSDIIKLLDKVVFFMINNQQTLNLSPHMNLYDILIPQDHPLRKINDLVDFSFVVRPAWAQSNR